MRLVSLVPSITEALAQLGRGDDVVGVTDFCLHPAEVVDRAHKIGGTKNPDLERIRELKPDLVIANTDEQRRETLDELEASGLDVLVTDTDTLDDIAETWTQLGNAVGREEAAERERHRLEAAIAAARSHAAARPRLTALVPVWRNPWMATGGGTYVGALLDACGFDNVLADIDDKWARFEPTLDTHMAAEREAVKGARTGQTVHALPRVPDVVLLPTEPYAFTDDDRHRFTELGTPASRVHIVDGELLTWWLSHTVDALGAFTDLHDELVETLNATTAD